MTTVFASAADERYGYHVVNLIGSVQANSDLFDRIVVFDLGMNSHQRAWLNAAPAVEVREVPAFVPHWNRGFTWKPWAWTHVDGDAVVWVDAGATVLRSLDPMVARIRGQGFVLVSQGNAVSDIVPRSYFELYGLPGEFATRPYAAAGILGFRPGGAFFERVLIPTYEDCLEGRNLGFSAAEVAQKNTGLGAGPIGAVHDCPHFRWDQSVLNARLLQTMPSAPLADLDEFGGWRSPRDHPHQLIWHHRRRGSMRYARRLRVPWPARFRWLAEALRLHLRWWLKLHGERFRPSTYALKARLTVRRRRIERGR